MGKTPFLTSGCFTLLRLPISLTSLYRQHQNQKRREYGFPVREVERGSFTPLVFTTNGGVAPEAATFLKRLASQISDKKNKPYSVVMNFLRCRLSFSILRSSLLCLRGSRSNRSLNTTVQPIPKVKSLPHFFSMFQWVDCPNFSWIEILCTKILLSFCRTKKFSPQRLKELL